MVALDTRHALHRQVANWLYGLQSAGVPCDGTIAIADALHQQNVTFWTYLDEGAQLLRAAGKHHRKSLVQQRVLANQGLDRAVIDRPVFRAGHG